LIGLYFIILKIIRKTKSREKTEISMKFLSQYIKIFFYNTKSKIKFLLEISVQFGRRAKRGGKIDFL